MRSGDVPVSDDEFAALFERDEESITALAVSGGPDSLALLHLADRWARRLRSFPKLLVLTVDHGLRPTSAAEAAMVGRLAAERGLPHRTLVWEGTKPTTGIEAAAREARYRLLAGAMHEAGARSLVTAHHQDDQAETVLMRLGRGSGIAGLGGMDEYQWSDAFDISIERPLLGIPKSRLVATVRAAGLPATDDETNADPRFTRARLRRIMPLLAEEGIDAARLTRLATRLRRVEEALEDTKHKFLRQHLQLDRLGVARLWHGELRQQPDEIRLRVLAELIALVGTREGPPAAAQLEALDEVIDSTERFRRTLGGAIVRTKGQELLFYREPGRGRLAEAPLPALHEGPSPGIYYGDWDSRFGIRVQGDADGLTLGPLGEAGYAELPPAFRPRPKAVALTLPAFRRGGRLVAVPPAGFRAEGGEGLDTYLNGTTLLGPGPGSHITYAYTRPGFLRNRE